MITTYGDISPRTAAYAAKEMLDRAEPHLILQQFAQSKPIPANSTQTVKFRRYNALPLATTALSEGVTPTGSPLTYDDVETSLSQYGDFVPLTDVVADTHEDPVFKETQGLIGEQAAQTVEALTYGFMTGGTNVMFANGEARDEVNTVLSDSLLRKAIRSLKRQNARYITKKVASTSNFNTDSIPPCYVGFVHTDLENTIRGLTGFIDVKDYGSTQPWEYEIGTVGNTRFLASTMLNPFADAGAAGATMIATTDATTAVDVYPVLIVAADSYALTPLKGKSAITPMVLNPNTPREGDPLGQRGYVSWKTWFAGLILNDAWFIRLEVAVLELT